MSLKGINDATGIFRLLRKGVDAHGATTVLVDATAGPVDRGMLEPRSPFALVNADLDASRKLRQCNYRRDKQSYSEQGSTVKGAVTASHQPHAPLETL